MIKKIISRILPKNRITKLERLEYELAQKMLKEKWKRPFYLRHVFTDGNHCRWCEYSLEDAVQKGRCPNDLNKRLAWGYDY